MMIVKNKDVNNEKLLLLQKILILLHTLNIKAKLIIKDIKTNISYGEIITYNNINKMFQILGKDRVFVFLNKVIVDFSSVIYDLNTEEEISEDKYVSYIENDSDDDNDNNSIESIVMKQDTI